MFTVFSQKKSNFSFGTLEHWNKAIFGVESPFVVYTTIGYIMQWFDRVNESFIRAVRITLHLPDTWCNLVLFYVAGV